jgi:hypothetical protein
MHRLAMILAITLALCTPSNAGTDLTPREWVSYPPNGMFHEVPEFAPSQYRLLHGRLRSTAIRLLAKQSYYPLPTGEAGKYGLKPQPDQQLFLVRGVAFNISNGKAVVRAMNGSIYVQHESLGPRSLALRFSPLVVSLHKAPESVFASATIDQ